MKDHLLTGLKGFAMGAANVVPGVSGGTIAVITGIYERLINALKGFSPSTVKLILKKDYKGAIEKTDLPFLVALGTGVIVSFVTLAKVLKWALVEHERLVMAFFFGLIFASIYFVGKMVRQWSGGTIALFILGASIAASMALLTPASENTNVFYLMLCGVVGMCSMIIPGLSGSFVLLLMGNYLLILGSINHLTAGNIGEAMAVIIPVGIGSVIGIASLAKGLSWLFKTYHDNAMSLVTGFIAGSLAIIWPWKTVAETIIVKDKVKPVSYDYFFPDFTSQESLLSFALVVAGIILMTLTEKLAPKA